jgi:glycosyltransferase involved in cell wall biosynthesis
MKILRIISSANPEGGGVIESVIQSSIAIKSLGHTVELLCHDSPNADWLSDTLIKIHAVGPASLKYGYCPKLTTWLDHNHQKYDHFIIEGLWQYHGLAARTVLVRNNRPYYVYSHGMLAPWFKKTYPLKHIKKYLYWILVEYKILRDAKNVVFTTDEERVLAKESFWFYKCEEIVISHGIPNKTYDKEAQKAIFLKQFPHLKSKQVLLFMGRISPVKGIDILIKSFSSQSKLLSNTELVIAGPDQVGWQSDLEQLAESLGIANRVTWTGMLSGDLKWGAYHCADAFILPSHQENFGIVVAEALSCNLPVLISNKVNIWREIENDSAGIIADDTLEGCNQLIQQWQQLSETEKNTYRVKARECFLNNFEINKAAETLISALNELI